MHELVTQKRMSTLLLGLCRELLARRRVTESLREQLHRSELGDIFCQVLNHLNRISCLRGMFPPPALGPGRAAAGTRLLGFYVRDVVSRGDKQDPSSSSDLTVRDGAFRLAEEVEQPSRGERRGGCYTSSFSLDPCHPVGRVRSSGQERRKGQQAWKRPGQAGGCPQPPHPTLPCRSPAEDKTLSEAARLCLQPSANRRREKYHQNNVSANAEHAPAHRRLPLTTLRSVRSSFPFDCAWM